MKFDEGKSYDGADILRWDAPDGTVLVNASLRDAGTPPTYRVWGDWVRAGRLSGRSSGWLTSGVQYRVVHIPPVSERDQLAWELAEVAYPDEARIPTTMLTRYGAVAEYVLEHFARRIEVADDPAAELDPEVVLDRDGDRWERQPDGTYTCTSEPSAHALNWLLSTVREWYGPLRDDAA